MTFIGSLSGQQSSNSSSGLSSLLGGSSGGGISGLASGMNTDSIVQGLVQAAQVPLANMLQQRQLDQWKAMQYQQVNTALTALQNSASTMKLQSSFLQQTSSSSNPSAVTANVGPLAASGTYDVSVSQLAQGATISSSQMLSTSSSYADTPLNQLTNGPTASFKVQLNNETFTFDPSKDTINSMLKAFSSDTTANVTGFYDGNAGRVVLQTKSTGTGAEIQVQSDPSNIFSNIFKMNSANSLQSSIAIPSGGLTQGGTVEVNGYKFNFSGSESQPLTIDSIIGAINGQTSTTGVVASKDQSGQHLILSSAVANGANTLYSPISVSDSSNFLGFQISQGAYRLTSGTAFPTSGTSTSNPVTINGHVIDFSTTTSLADVESQINKLSGTTGVTATDDGYNHLVLASNAGPIQVSDSSNFLGLQNATSTSVAQDANYTVNGYSSTSSTNTANYNGISLNFQSVTSSPATVTVSTNVNAVVQSVQNFVQQYNTTLQTMQGLYNQTRNYDYAPLTTLQAQQMTQTQIDQWNQKAQSGMLANDSILNSAMNGLVQVGSAVVTGQTKSNLNGQPATFNSLASIGITQIDPMAGVASGNIAPGVTTSGWNSYGLLQIDTQKLTSALQADPQAVMNLFTNDPTLPGAKSGMGAGIATQTYNSLVSSISDITQEAGSGTGAIPNSSSTAGITTLPYTLIDPNGDFNTLFGADSLDTSFIGQAVTSLDQQAQDMQTNIDSLRTRYQNQFTAMEQAMASLSTQSSYLAGMMGASSSGG